MIYDILEVFKKEYEEKGDKLILDNYILKDGLYIKINQNNSMECFIFSNNKKEVKKENCFRDLDGNIQSSMYAWFKERDYYSSYLNSNKSFYDKKLHNVNYFSLFVKVESFTSDDAKKQLNENAIKEQYKFLCNYKKFKKPKEKEILETFRDYLSDRVRRKDIVKKYRCIRDNLQNIVEEAVKNSVTNYIKIFFNEEIENYKDESSIYYAIKIFNDIGYSKKVEENIYGLSDSNMGLNSKKPYLEQKTRKISTPFMIVKDDAVLIKKFFDWLKIQEFKEKYPLTDELFLNRDFREKDLLVDFDYLPIKIDKLESSIDIKNYLLVYKDKKLMDDSVIDYLWQLENSIDEVFYNGQLKNNYFGEVYKKLDNSFANLIYMTRDAMINYFKKYDEKAFYQVVKKYGTNFVIDHLSANREFKAKESLNLKLSLLEYKGDKVMDIQGMQKKIIKKLETSDYDSSSSEEFFYLCGQVVKYLLSQSEAHEKNADLMEPFLRSNSAQKIKKNIEFSFFKYKHKISLNHVKFNNAMSLIMAYQEKDKLVSNMDSFLVGVLSQNIFYMKKEEQ